MITAFLLSEILVDYLEVEKIPEESHFQAKVAAENLGKLFLDKQALAETLDITNHSIKTQDFIQIWQN